MVIKMTASNLKRVLNWYPPYVGAGIRVSHIAPDFRTARMEMKLSWYNRNYVGTHFGGSLYSMCDPLYMLMLLNILGPKQYICWDKGATIDYVQPGKGTVVAEFEISEGLINELQAMAPDTKKVFDLKVNVVDAISGDIVARITKTEYVKRKAATPQSSSSSWPTSKL
jgi:acyl-coenzyme A thioesterase PaaI-like protein